MDIFCPCFLEALNYTAFVYFCNLSICYKCLFVDGIRYLPQGTFRETVDIQLFLFDFFFIKKVSSSKFHTKNSVITEF